VQGRGQTRELLAQETARWQEVIKTRNIQANA